MFNLYVEPMWQDERYETVKVTDRGIRIFIIAKPQKGSKRKVETIYTKP